METIFGIISALIFAVYSAVVINLRNLLPAGAPEMVFRLPGT